MIGILADPADRAVVQEFFELFKTPWELYRPGKSYDVVLCAGEDCPRGLSAKVVLLYSSGRLPFDSEHKNAAEITSKQPRFFQYKGFRVPVYGDLATFPIQGNGLLPVDQDPHRSAIYLSVQPNRIVARVGYDLFQEVLTLLTAGQPIANAGIPTLELHISLLRDLIVSANVPLIEIPPLPAHYSLIASLTHDVDHPSIRKHKLDHTLFGFLYRAVVGSVMNLMKSRMSVGDVLKNWAAVLRLPFIHLGLASDIWYQFDRYVELEGGAHSTFFFIPFKGEPGISDLGRAPSHRASPYAVAEYADRVVDLMKAGCEIGVHGIDAWADSPRGTEEIGQIREITGKEEVGARMHWLYFDAHSPATLEQAGASYDSTVGYNETIGYRAGTSQAYKPLDVTRLLELPMHVMDTALFYPSYLNLSPSEAEKQVDRIVENATLFGGCVTVNWHDRSIAPERLWGDFYCQLVRKLRSQGAWFATAGEVVAWFRKRRSIVFESVSWESNQVRIKIAADTMENLPDLQVRVHYGHDRSQSVTVSAGAPAAGAEIAEKYSMEASVALP